MRKSGILMPVFSLPSNYGIGSFSKEAYEFVDFLESAGQSYWQILPLGPTSYGDSPYQSFSTFAGNPYFIDIEALIEEKLLTKKEADAMDFGKNDERIDYEKIYKSRFKLLKKAYDRSGLTDGFKGTPLIDMDSYKTFEKENSEWLDDYALFMALKDSHGGCSWNLWEEDIRLRKPEALKKAGEKYCEEVKFYKFLQYLFFTQWKKLKDYANSKNVDIIGDIPIYVAFDSADTWASPELFQLDEENMPIAVAGCPPDAFSATGQLWGNPLYKWEHHKKTGFKWWVRRIAGCYKLYDVIRIDHFRGFDEYYSIPFGNPTAEKGQWEKGPGYELFKTVKQELGNLRIIAEDLGYLTPSVIALVKKTGYPGMKILQFAFDSREESDYLPHNYEKNSIVYTGTHDNETTRAWYNTIPRKDRAYARKYTNIRNPKNATWDFIRLAFGSVSNTAIIPIQDYLDLGTEARINIPSTLGNNWVWRMKKDALSEELASKINELVQIYKR
ncbi:MAG: 4-alpha-glucanotransferase [Butyrivibrio sp.]|nr:4-alpha-glucanotransferase [Butyrivibrio sp.]